MLDAHRITETFQLCEGSVVIKVGQPTSWLCGQKFPAALVDHLAVSRRSPAVSSVDSWRFCADLFCALFRLCWEQMPGMPVIVSVLHHMIPGACAWCWQDDSCGMWPCR